MVLCQIYVNDSNKTLYPINVYGKKKVRIVKIDLRSTNLTTGNPAYYLIRIQSDILRLPYGNYPYLVLNTNPAYQIGNIHGDLEFNVNFVGNLDIEIINHDTGISPTYFIDMVLYLDIQDAE